MAYEGFNIGRVIEGLDPARGGDTDTTIQQRFEPVFVEVSEKDEFVEPVRSHSKNKRNGNWHPSRGVAVGAVAVAAALVAGALVTSTSKSNQPESAAPVDKPAKPVIVPANPLPTLSSSAQPSQNIINSPAAIPNSDTIPYVLGQISFGEKGKDCTEKGSVTTATFAKTEVPFELKGIRFTLTIPETKVQEFTCGTDIKEFIQVGDEVTMQSTDGEYKVLEKQVLINNDSFEVGLLPFKYAPSVKEVLPAQIAQRKGYKGAIDYCVAFPNTVGCKGVKVPAIYRLPAGILPVIVLSTEIGILKETQQVCATQQDAAVSEIIHDFYVNQAKNQNVDPSVVSQVFLDSAGQQVKKTTDFVGSTVTKLYKKDKTGMVKGFEKVFTPYVSGKVTCSNNRQRK